MRRKEARDLNGGAAEETGINSSISQCNCRLTQQPKHIQAIKTTAIDSKFEKQSSLSTRSV